MKPASVDAHCGSEAIKTRNIKIKNSVIVQTSNPVALTPHHAQNRLRFHGRLRQFSVIQKSLPLHGQQGRSCPRRFPLQRQVSRSQVFLGQGALQEKRRAQHRRRKIGSDFTGRNITKGLKINERKIAAVRPKCDGRQGTFLTVSLFWPTFGVETCIARPSVHHRMPRARTHKSIVAMASRNVAYCAVLRVVRA